MTINTKHKELSMPYAGPALRITAIAVVAALLATACKGREIPAAPAGATTTAPRAPAIVDPTDWCAEHALPESMCAKCDPSLVDRFRSAGDWCAEHGLPESVCPACNPMQPPTTRAPVVHRDGERAGDPADWCGGHGLPESMCTKCSPGLVERYRRAGDWCAEHGFPESVCPACNPMQAHRAGAPAPKVHGSRVGDPADWCGGHGLPESMCTKCSPGLVERYRRAGDWCAEHGFPESVCPACNPMQAPGARAPAPEVRGSRVGDPADWCAEHGLRESKCTVCNSALVDHFRDSGDWCAEHGYPESVCPSCNPMQPPVGAPRPSVITAGTRIRFRTPAIERAAGIEAVPATADAIGIGIETTARIDFNRNAMADVRSAVPGIVREISVDLGQHVTVGDSLFTLESAHVGDLQAGRQAARGRVDASRANLARQQDLRKGAIASQRQVELAQQDLGAAEAQLRSIDQSLRISGASHGGQPGRFDVRAPITGTVIRRPALLGSFAGESDSLSTIADTSVLWALLDVPEWDVIRVRAGQPVELRVDGVAGQTFRGTVTWIAAEVDPRTRSVTARAEVHNPDGRLRVGQFARATVRVAAVAGGVTVPIGAVQRLGDESVVFVRTGEGLYEPRVVRPGRSDGRRVQLAGEIRAGEAIVTTGAFLLRTELSRDSIGAGCCDVEGSGGN